MYVQLGHIKTKLSLMNTKFIFIIFAIINLKTIAQPSNDEPCGAITLNITNSETCTNPTLISWTGATTSSVFPIPTCGFLGNNKKDVWYKFVAPNSTNVTITTSIGTTQADYTLSVYEATDCNTNFNHLACNDDGIDAYPILSVSNLIAGKTYYIRIWAWSSIIADGELNICLNSLSLSSGKVGVGVTTPTTTLDVNGNLRIRGGAPTQGKKLISDNYGNATWGETVISTEWIFAQSTGNVTKDTTFDNTCLKMYHIPVPQITQEVLNKKLIITYFRVGTIGPYALPYTSDAGGPTSQINCIYRVGEIIVLRHTFNSCRYNGSIVERYPGEPIMTPLPLGLEFRVVISN